MDDMDYQDQSEGDSGGVATMDSPDISALEAWGEPAKPKAPDLSDLEAWGNPTPQQQQAAGINRLNKEVGGHVEHLMGGANPDGSKRYATEPTNEAIDQQLGDRLEGQPEELKQHVRDQYRGALLNKLIEGPRNLSLVGRMADDLTGYLPFASSVQGIVNAKGVSEATSKIEKGAGSLDDFHKLADYLREQKRLEKRGFGKMVAENLAALPAVATEFYMTGGWLTSSKLAAEKGIVALAKRAALGGVERTVANVPRLAEAYQQQKMPSVGIQDGQIAVGPEKSDAEAATNAVVNKFIENAAFSFSGPAGFASKVGEGSMLAAGGKGVGKLLVASEGSKEAQLQATSTGKGSTINRLYKGDPKALRDFAAELVTFVGAEAAGMGVKRVMDRGQQAQKQGYRPGSKAIQEQMAKVAEAELTQAKEEPADFLKDHGLPPAVKAEMDAKEPYRVAEDAGQPTAEKPATPLPKGYGLKREGPFDVDMPLPVYDRASKAAEMANDPGNADRDRPVVAPESTPVASEPAGRLESAAEPERTAETRPEPASDLPPTDHIAEREGLAKLTVQERDTLDRRFHDAETLESIAKSRGVTRQAIASQEAKILGKLGSPHKSIDEMRSAQGIDRPTVPKSAVGGELRNADEGTVLGPDTAPGAKRAAILDDLTTKAMKLHEIEMSNLKRNGKLKPKQEQRNAKAVEEFNAALAAAVKAGENPEAIAGITQIARGNKPAAEHAGGSGPAVAARRPEPAAGRDQPVPGEGAAGPAAERPRTGPGSRGGVIRKPRAGASLNAQVRHMGYIDPQSEALKAHYGSMTEAVQDGIPMNVFKKGGQGLDAIAEELANNGYIQRSEGEHVTETLLNALRARKEHSHFDSTPEVEKQFEEHYRHLQEMQDVKAAQKEAMQAGVSERAAQEALRDGLRDKIEDAEADASFDFGANEVPAPKSGGGRQLDMYGNKEPIKFRTRKGGQVTMDDALRETTMRKAEEYAEENGLKIVRRESPNRFWTEDGTKYEVGKAEDGYPITAVDGPPRADRMTARDLEEAFIAEGIQKGRSTAQQADFTDPAQPGDPEVAQAQSRTRKGVDNLRYNWRELSGEQYPRVADKSESAADAMVRFASSRQHAERAAPYYIDAILKDVTDYKVPDKDLTQKDRDSIGKLFMETFHEERFRHAREQYHTLSDKAFDRASRADAALRKVRRQLQTESDSIEIKNLKRERDGLKKLKADSEKEGKEWRSAAEAVVTFVGGYNSELGRESKYQETLKNKGYQEFNQRWTKEVVPLMNKFFKMAEGMEPDAEIDSLTQLPGRPFNAKAIKEGDNTPAENIVRVAGSKSGDLRNPKLYKLGFARRFTGASSRGYDVNPAAVIEHSIRESVQTGTKAEMFRELEKSGLLKWGKPGERHTFDGKAGEVFPDINPPKGTQMAGEGETRAFVHPDIKSDLRKALDLNERWGQYQAAKFITGASLTSLVEATTHGKNNFSMIWKPGVMPQDVVKSFAGVIKQDPATWKRIVELAELGAVKSHGLESASLDLKYDPTKYVRMVSGKLLEVTDTAMRLTMDKAFDRLAARGWAEDTPANRRNFINQVGQYNRLSQNKYVQWLRDTGWGPFATAATNYTVQGIRALMLSPGVKATGLRGAVMMRAEMLLRNSVAMGLVAATNYALWNSVFGDDKTPLGSIKLRNLPGGKSLTFDVGGMVGLPRGARTLGLLALAEGSRAGAPNGAIAEKFAEDVTHGLTHPAEGPAYQFLHGAATGHNSIGMPIAPDVHDKNFTTRAGEIGHVQKFQDVLGAIKNLNPTLAALLGWARPRAKGERSDWETGSQLLGPIAPKVRSTTPVPTQERRSVSVPVKPGR